MSLNNSLVSKFNQICRTCLKEGQILTYLYDEQNSINLVNKLKTCTAIEFDESDQMPNKICPSCIEELLQAFNFINKCQINDATLRKYFSNENVIKIEDVPLESPENPHEEMKSEIINETNILDEDNEPEYFEDTCDITIKDEFLYMMLEESKITGNVKNQKRKRADSAPDLMECTENLNYKKPASDDNNLLINAENLNKTFSVESTSDDRTKYVRKTRSEMGKENLNNLNTKNVYKERTNAGKRKEKKLSCPICSKRMVKTVTLLRHFQSHTDTKKEKKKGARKSKSLTAKIKQNKCEICQETFNKPAELISHYKQHIKSNKCEYCDKLFIGLKMRKHIRLKHAGLQPYECDMCAKNFPNVNAMQSHKRQFHSPKKSLKCTMCSYTFDMDAQLVAHERDHVGEPPYTCQTCNSMFDEARLLITHKIAEKCGKFYNCPGCLKVFQSVKNKNVHKLKEH